MKKLMTLMLALSFLATTAVVTFAQDTTTTAKTKKPKTKSKKPMTDTTTKSGQR